MFPIMPSVAYDDRYHEIQRATGRETRPASRIGTQRQLLEHNRMYHLNSLSVDDRARDRDRDLLQRQMIAQARGNDRSPMARFRQSLGGALISIGERIRPPFSPNEPTYNA